MRFFNRFSLKTKLIWIIMLTSCSVLLLAAVAVVWNDTVIYRQAQVRNLEIMGGIIGFNSAAAITFNDRNAARDVLTSLHVEPHIVAASIYKKDGSLFAQYSISQADHFCQGVPDNDEGYHFLDGFLVVHEPILLKGEKIGSLCLQSDLEEMNSVLKRIVSVIVLIVLVALGLAMFLSSNLQRIISEPIFDLARTIKKISREKNYAYRAQKFYNDEIGLLVDGFNDMLTQVEQHGRELERHQETLEMKVAARTEELSESEERFRQLSQATFEAVIIHAGNRIIEVNQSFTDMFGYSRQEGLRMKIIDFVLPEGHNTHRSKKAADSSSVYETTALRKDGSTFHAEVCVKTINYQGITVLVKAVRNIDERKRMENELLKARKLESIGVLAGGIAHDFNNLLTVILGNISLVRATSQPDDSRLPGMLDAEKACQRAKDLAGQLLTFSKGGAPVKRITSIDDVIIEAVSFSLRGSNVKCRFDLAPDLWQVDIDSSQMGQVFHNLVINACQAMPDGGNIFIKTQNELITGWNDIYLAAGSYVKITITDQGIGISPENAGRIFDPYFTTKEQGSGLGLASCYSIVKKHDGVIAVDSQPGESTTFTLYLPAIHKHRKKPMKRRQKTIAQLACKVLIMDDEAMVRDVAGALLRRIGCQVDFAADGQETVDKYRQSLQSGSPFDVVLMDLTIPGGMGGKEAMQHLQALHPGVKVIVSSGYANDPVMADYKQYGFADVVAKPYVLQQLSDALEKIMSADAS